MNIAELIEFLKTHPQDLEVAYGLYSEQVLLRQDQIQIQEHCKPRPDGWIQDKRKDMETQFYLIFPGN